VKVPEGVKRAARRVDTSGLGLTYWEAQERRLEAALEQLREELLAVHVRTSVNERAVRAALNSVLGDKEKGR
jgi:hypothetical protein